MQAVYIADLHIHSKYSRATSKNGVPEELDLWARRKGIGLIGTGDFTHPAWRQSLEETLIPAEEGLYMLRSELRLPDGPAGDEPDKAARFVLSGEISSIYKKNGKTRKVHNVILLPSLEAAGALSRRLEAVGNIHSDGRPILGLDSRDLLEITLDVCPEAIFIPAHIWTPHFSVFGAFSGFDTLEECFEDLTPQIHALETGLSSDPPMNWRLSALDGYTLVSNSDAHSPAKLGREANLIDAELSYSGLKRAIEGGASAGFGGTIEFFPEEGKYHLDGHRNCNLCLKPAETEQLHGRCPVCGKKITIGVEHRVEQLSDRPEGYRPPNALHYESLVPLPEVIAVSCGLSAASKKVDAQYMDLLARLGPEFYILREASIEEISHAAGPYVAEGIRRLRSGEVERIPGYDGEYGTIKLMDEADRRALGGQVSLLSADELREAKPKSRRIPARKRQSEEMAEELQPQLDEKAGGLDGLNREQAEAVAAPDRIVAVVAGPGTGKTKTLVSKIAYLIERLGIKPQEITAVTFTNKAAGEMRERLERRLGGKRAVRGMTIGTFHAVCLQLLQEIEGEVCLIGEEEALVFAAEAVRTQGLKLSPAQFLREVSRCRQAEGETESRLPCTAVEAYERLLEGAGVTDLDGLLIKTLSIWHQGVKPACARRFRYLLVDEFQDINAIQYQLVRAWSERGKNLFVIGDPDQAIYGFRGASPACFAQLMEEEEVRLVRLVKNYRSTPQILSCALSVISADTAGARQLAAQCPDGDKVSLLTAQSPLSEGIYVAKEIGRLVGGIDMLAAHDYAHRTEEKPVYGFSDIAILYRTHRQAELLESCLQKEGIPYVVMGRDDFLNDTAVRQALCFFSFLLWRREAFYLRMYLQLSGYEETAAREMAARWQAAQDNAEAERALAADMPEVAALFEKYAPRAAKEKPEALLQEWTQEMGLTDSDPMKRLLYTAVFHKTMEELLRNLTLGQESDLMRGEKKAYAAGAVTLMTLHGAKGLEFPAVFLCGVKKGTIPLELKGRKTDIGEERRLFYVGITRAKERLYMLTGPEPSPFLADIAPACLQRGDTLERQAPQGRQLSLFELK